MRAIQPIVEGDGDVLAVPVLLRRLAAERGIYDLHVHAPYRCGDLGKALKNFDTDFKIAIKSKAPVLWVLDFDDKNHSCVKELAETFYRRVAEIRPWHCKVAFTVKEFENLFLADPETVRNCFDDISPEAVFPSNPETIRGAKEWISKQRPSGRAYKEKLHQPKLAAQINLDVLRQNSPSFRHLEKAFEYLMSQTAT